MRSSIKSLLLVGAASCAFQLPCVNAYTDTSTGGAINVGRDNTFTILTSGDLNDTNNTMLGSTSKVTGNIAIGGHGNFSMSNSSYVTGDIVMNQYGTFTMDSTSRHIGKTYYNQDTNINNALTDTQSLSDAAFAEAVTPAFAGLTNVNLSNGAHMSITGAANQKVVLDLTDFSLSSGSWFTLKGTATTTFIINVTNTFSLTGASWISLSNVPPRNVLFNVVGTGSQVVMSGNSYMYGILLAKKRQVALTGSWIKGRLIAEQLSLTNGGQVCSQ